MKRIILIGFMGSGKTTLGKKKCHKEKMDDSDNGHKHDDNNNHEKTY